LFSSICLLFLSKFFFDATDDFREKTVYDLKKRRWYDLFSWRIDAKPSVLPPAGQGISTAKSLINPVPLGHQKFPRPSLGFAWAGQIGKPDDLTARVFSLTDGRGLAGWFCFLGALTQSAPVCLRRDKGLPRQNPLSNPCRLDTKGFQDLPRLLRGQVKSRNQTI
jgi:hypothetical protein